MNKKKHSRSQIAKRWLLGWTLFIGIGAVAGATGMLSDPSGKAMGMAAMLPYFQGLPFADRLPVKSNRRIMCWYTIQKEHTKTRYRKWIGF